MMIPILNTFYGWTHSYGLAIVLITLVIRLVIFPLSAKQYSNMRAMQHLQPKLKEMQAKYKDNPQELNQAMMGFYQEHKVNPFGSCLPLVIQMPFLIALYQSLYSKDFTQEITNSGHAGFLFIQDLTHRALMDPATHMLHWDNAVLVAIFGITTFITQKIMMTDPNDPMQKQMLYMMPVMITGMFVFVPLPAGVLLYTVISNFFTLGQYLIFQRMYPKPPGSSGPGSGPASGQTIDVKPIR